MPSSFPESKDSIQMLSYSPTTSRSGREEGTLNYPQQTTKLRKEDTGNFSNIGKTYQDEDDDKEEAEQDTDDELYLASFREDTNNKNRFKRSSWILLSIFISALISGVLGIYVGSRRGGLNILISQSNKMLLGNDVE
jgi:hypothetical protein